MLSSECKSNSGELCNSIIILFIFTAVMTGEGGGRGVQAQLTSKEHRTNAFEKKTRELWCYHCNTMDSGEQCERLLDNKTEHHLKCQDKMMCMVKTISLTTSTGNSTSQPKLWLLERNCSKTCESGCIVIGERTKLYACTKCCEVDFCNFGRSGAITTTTVHILFLVFVVITITSDLILPGCVLTENISFYSRRTCSFF